MNRSIGTNCFALNLFLAAAVGLLYPAVGAQADSRDRTACAGLSASADDAVSEINAHVKRRLGYLRTNILTRRTFAQTRLIGECTPSPCLMGRTISASQRARKLRCDLVIVTSTCRKIPLVLNTQTGRGTDCEAALLDAARHGAISIQPFVEAVLEVEQDIVTELELETTRNRRQARLEEQKKDWFDRLEKIRIGFNELNFDSNAIIEDLSRLSPPVDNP